MTMWPGESSVIVRSWYACTIMTAMCAIVDHAKATIRVSIDLHAPHHAFTTRSISTQAPSGNAATPIVVRAGKGSLKYFA